MKKDRRNMGNNSKKKEHKWWCTKPRPMKAYPELCAYCLKPVINHEIH